MFLWPKNFSGTRLSARKGFIDDNVMETIWIASSLCCPGLPLTLYYLPMTLANYLADDD